MTEAAPASGLSTARAREDWLGLVRKTLKGGEPERLSQRTADGITVQPLYDAAADALPLRTQAAEAERPWDLRTRVTHPDPARANAQMLTDLEGGAASVLLALDSEGARGVRLGSADALKRVLDGVLLDLAPVALDAGHEGAVAAGWLAEAAGAVPSAPLAFHMDPLGALAEFGPQTGGEGDPLAAAAQSGVRIASAFADATLFLASGRAVHEAGGSEAQELGFAIAGALAYAKALDGAGIGPGAALGRIVLGLAADAEPVLTIAKLRAARVVWSRFSAACGADVPARIEARSSRRMLARLDPWTNMLRITAAGFGAAVGGADAVVLGAFTDALGEPTDFARRQARNTQLVLMEEAHLGRVSDPAAGSGLVEALTDALARAAWSVFQAIESQGGALAVITSGWLGGEVARARTARQADYARRKAGLIGVTEFPAPDDAPVQIEPVSRPAPSGVSPGALLTPIRWAEPFEALRARGALAETPVALALLGPPAEHAARAGFARSLLAIAGLRTAEADAASTPSGPLAVLCGSDERYAEEAEAAARALKAAGVGRVWLAGRPGEREAALRSAGVDRFIFAGGDAPEALEEAISAVTEAGKVST